MKVRQHRGGLEESLATTVSIPPTIEALTLFISSVEDLFINSSAIHVEKYCYDDRIWWDTYIITVDGLGVFGFTDGPLIDI